MAEYISREAAYQFMFDIPNPDGAGEIEVVSVDDLDAIPAADVVEVVRCKDCKHYNRRYFELSGKYYGTFCDLYHYGFKPDFFCAKGEKREVEHGD